MDTANRKKDILVLHERELSYQSSYDGFFLKCMEIHYSQECKLKMAEPGEGGYFE